MKAADPISGRSFRPLSLHVPEPRFRPGDAVDYSDLRIDPAGAVQRPPIDASARGMSDLAYALVRVLDDEGRAVGPWDPRLPPGRLLKMLRSMALTRAFDDRMYRAQRQGKTSFSMKSHGEAAVGTENCRGGKEVVST